jgi:hypothetical protein
VEVAEKLAVALARVSDAEARVVATLLEGFSIRCWIRSPLPAAIFPLPVLPATLLVPESRLAEAEKLIRTYLWQPRLVYSRGREI